MNQKVVISQLRQLLKYLSQQVELVGNPRLKQISFDRQLFKEQYPTLDKYIYFCVNTLNKIEENEQKSTSQWQIEHLLTQCQAIQKVIFTLPKHKKNTFTQQEELAGYERRLLKMVADLDVQIAQASSFHEQQQLLSTLDITRQRLHRCQMAQKDYAWKKIVS
ncbi:primosomal replication protein PriC [Rosenbergiella australiborealis]|uniref:primosomal replication protein PriC n=1 Tax=Rosenbergiella australiborealis TaxID=1544696 RepID=UPI001F4DEC44|nr:primosomal replication protein PriC [Rosenbergiella australiborealis]